MTAIPYRRVAQLRSSEQLRAHLAQIGVEIDFDETVAAGEGAPLAQPYTIYGKTLANRFCVLPMEGWTAVSTANRPTWYDGAGNLWHQRCQTDLGGEAVAVRHDGRANHRQLVINEQTAGQIAELRDLLVAAHHDQYGSADDLLIGLQLTHSGRFCRPNSLALEPKILYHHPLLDAKYGLPDDYPLMTDTQIDDLIGDFVIAAKRAYQAGFDFVDIKHCHGYLGHELLTAIDRPGRYGGSFENRTRFLREVVAGIRRDVPDLHIGVRLSAFDWIPFSADDSGVGTPVSWSQAHYPYAFGGDGNGTNIDLTEPHAFLNLLQSLDVRLVCITGGSPYYTPHIQRPALFPPSDGTSRQKTR